VPIVAVQQFAAKTQFARGREPFSQSGRVRIVVSTATTAPTYAAKWECTGVEIRRPKIPARTSSLHLPLPAYESRRRLDPQVFLAVQSTLAGEDRQAQIAANIICAKHACNTGNQ